MGRSGHALDAGDGKTVGSIALRVALVAFLVALIGGIGYLRTFPPMATVMSESMAPTIGVGDIVIFKSTRGAPPVVGDVVEITVPDEYREKYDYPGVVIHRIIGHNENGTFKTKGDNLSSADPFDVKPSMATKKVVFTIPVAGRLLGFLFSPFGLLWIAIGLLIFVVMPFYDVQKERAELHQIEVASLDELKSKLVDLESGGSIGPDGGRVPFVSTVDLTQPVVVESDPEVKETLQELVGAVGEYGHHLRSHTAVLQSMSAASQDLATVVAELKAQLRGEESPKTGPAALPTLAAPVLEWLQRSTYTEWSLVAPEGVAADVGCTAEEVCGAIEALAEASLLELDPVAPPDLYRYRLA